MNPRNASDQADISLWDNFRHGSKADFEALYYQYVDQLCNYGMHIFLDRTVVEDSIQDLFLELWQRRQFLRDTDCLRSYLYKSLKRKILRKLHTRENANARCKLSSEQEHEVSESPETAAIMNEYNRRTSEIFLHALKHLPEKQREIIVYRFYNDLSSRQIASVMSLSIDATYTLLSRSLHSLKKIVQERYPFIILLTSFF